MMPGEPDFATHCFLNWGPGRKANWLTLETSALGNSSRNWFPMLRSQGWVRLNSTPVPWKPTALMGDTWRQGPCRDRKKAMEQILSPNSTPALEQTSGSITSECLPTIFRALSYQETRETNHQAKDQHRLRADTELITL